MFTHHTMPLVTTTAKEAPFSDAFRKAMSAAANDPGSIEELFVGALNEQAAEKKKKKKKKKRKSSAQEEEEEEEEEDKKHKKGKKTQEVVVVAVAEEEEDDDNDMMPFVIDRQGDRDWQPAAEEINKKKKKKKQKSSSKKKKKATQLQPQRRSEEGCAAMAHLGEHSWTTAGYALTGAYFQDREKLRMARHHIDSMNHFYHHQVPDTIRMFNAHRVDPVTGVSSAPMPHRMVSSLKDRNPDTNDFNLSICYDIGNLRYYMPQMIEASGEIKPMWPADAFMRSRTYAARTKVDIHVTVRHRYDSAANGADANAFTTQQYTIPDVDFVQMPILVNSDLCMQGVQRPTHIQSTYDKALADARARAEKDPEAYAQRIANAAPLSGHGKSVDDQDCGGYFIIKGSPKVVIAQEHGTENRIHVFPHKQNMWRGWMAQMASVPDDRCVSPKCLNMGLLPKGNLFGFPIHVALPATRMKKNATMSLFLLFRAMGVMRDRDICEIILGGPIKQADQTMLADLRASMFDADQILKREEFQIIGGGEKQQQENGAPQAIMDDGVLRERAVAYIQSTLSIYDLRNARINALPTARGGMPGGPRMPKVERYTPEQTMSHACYPREDNLSATAAIASTTISSRVSGRQPTGNNSMDTPLLASPPAELVEYVQGATYVRRQAVFRHCEARRNVHNEFHKYFRQHATITTTTTAAAAAAAETRKVGIKSKKPDEENDAAPKKKKKKKREEEEEEEEYPEVASEEETTPWYKFMLAILSVRRSHQQRSRQSDWHRSQTLRVLDNDLLPHCKNNQKTVFMLGLMANRLLRVVRGELPPSDRDAYLAKRVEPTGVQMNNLFRHLYLRFQKELDRQIKCAIEASGSWKLPRDIFTSENAHLLFNPTLIETGLVSALNSGDFSTKQTRDGNTKAGVAQVLNRLNLLAMLSHIRRVNTPIAGKNGELVAPRKLHATTYGFLCPVETPEGRPVGLVKQLALLTVLTLPQLHSAVLYETAETLASALEIGNARGYAGVRLLINGTWVGVARDPPACVAALRDAKLRCKFSPFTSVVFDHTLNEIRVCTDAGRMCRPLLRVNPATGRVFLEQRHLDSLKNKTLQWDDLMLRRDGAMDEPVFEYLDVEEQAFALIIGYDDLSDSSKNIMERIASTKCKMGDIYCEIHPMTILGVIANTTPFLQCNQSPRNTYQSAMAKQAMGFCQDLKSRTDKTVLNMNFANMPLVATETSRILKCSERPAGSMCYVGIMSNTGFNQEDSIILSQASIDRGLFLCTVYKTEKDSDRGREEVERCNPTADPAMMSKTRGIKLNSDYSQLDKNGLNPENSHLKNKQVLIGKRIPVRRDGAPAMAGSVTGLPVNMEKGGDHLYEDRSKVVQLTSTEDAYVDKNTLSRDGDGCVTCRVTYRINRKMAPGDKLASRSAQKSTDGCDEIAENMPFTHEGTNLDALLNPHAITSRMTVGHLMESNFGKVLATLGLFGDCSAFCEVSAADIADELRKCGFCSKGTEVFYNGHTGQPFTAEIFAGNMYYQRLKHMVNDKRHSRTTGPDLVITRQPVDGRSKGGGLRMGEMERDCVLSHGAAEFMKDRLFYNSDPFTISVCNQCGLNAVVNAGDKSEFFSKKGDRMHVCMACDNSTDFSRKDLPYAAKLFQQELMTAHVQTRIL